MEIQATVPVPDPLVEDLVEIIEYLLEIVRSRGIEVEIELAGYEDYRRKWPKIDA